MRKRRNCNKQPIELKAFYLNALLYLSLSIIIPVFKDHGPTQLVQSQACAKGEIAANIPIQEPLMQWTSCILQPFLSHLVSASLWEMEVRFVPYKQLCLYQHTQGCHEHAEIRKLNVEHSFIGFMLNLSVIIVKSWKRVVFLIHFWDFYWLNQEEIWVNLKLLCP